MKSRLQVICSDEQATAPLAVPSPAPPQFTAVVPERMKQSVLPEFDRAAGFDKPLAHTAEHTDSSGTTVPGHIGGVYAFAYKHHPPTVVQSIIDNVVIDAEWYMVYGIDDWNHDEPADQRDRQHRPWQLASGTSTHPAESGSPPDVLRPV